MNNCIWSRCNATEVKFDAKYHAAYLAAYHAAYLPAFLGVVEWCGVGAVCTVLIAYLDHDGIRSAFHDSEQLNIYMPIIMSNAIKNGPPIRVYVAPIMAHQQFFMQAI